MPGNINKKSYVKPGHQSSKTPLFVMTGILAVLFLWIMSQLAGPGTPFSGRTPVTASQENGTQVISMKLTPSGYSPDHVIVRKGVAVRVETDATSDAGCVRGIMIPDFQINKALNIGQDSLTFTPDKTGTFTFSCQMKMSTGKITVT